VHLSWQVSPGQVVMTWRESGGPPVTVPQRSGLGLQMISSGAQSQMGGDAHLEWKPGGLVCTLTLPTAEGRNRARVPARRAAAAELAAPDQEGKPRILLVEDEPLVAMMMTGFLDQLDCVALGPCATRFEALGFLKEQAVDAAILDVNLGGEPVYAVAEALARLGLPFAFVTGYGRESIDPRYAEAIVLQKPLGFDELRAAVRDLCAAAPAERINLRA
jgi:CheY-like chemotaxis protein